MSITGDRYILMNKDRLCEEIISSYVLDNIFEYGIVVEDTREIKIIEGEYESSIIMYQCKFKDKDNILRTTLLPKCLVDNFFEKL